MSSNLQLTKLVDTIVEKIDIPKSYYEKAANRHRSLSEFLCRPESKLAPFRPKVSPQGSFRYGTVTRPLDANCAYDLDNVATLLVAKTAMTQRQIKQIYGAEVAAYAEANRIAEPLEEHNRCWRLVYSDEVAFHLDTLPCIPEEPHVITHLVSLDVPQALANLSVAITDRRHPQYDLVTCNLLSSNPRGFAVWFEEQTRPWALERIRQLVGRGLYKSVEAVPPYEWRTPLQRSIQFLKRHRDVMFRQNPELAPISMIITNLAARAYSGETDIASALTNIVAKMPDFIRPTRPRVPNPAAPTEDYADKWAMNPTLERNFWLWHGQAMSDISRLPGMLAGNRLRDDIYDIFQVDLSDRDLEPWGARPVAAAARVAPAVSIVRPARPWGDAL